MAALSLGSQSCAGGCHIGLGNGCPVGRRQIDIPLSLQFQPPRAGLGGHGKDLVLVIPLTEVESRGTVLQGIVAVAHVLDAPHGIGIVLAGERIAQYVVVACIQAVIAGVAAGIEGAAVRGVAAEAARNVVPLVRCECLHVGFKRLKGRL